MSSSERNIYKWRSGEVPLRPVIRENAATHETLYVFNEQLVNKLFEIVPSVAERWVPPHDTTERNHNVDPFEYYMQDVKRYPKLTVDEVNMLTDNLATARNTLNRSDSSLPTVGEIDRAQDEKTAIEQILFLTSLRLVVRMAKWYQGRGMDLPDLVQEGNMILMRAIQTYDPDKGEFTDHAANRLKFDLKRVLQQKSQLIYISTYRQEILQSYYKTRNAFITEHGREPRIEEVAQLLGTDTDEIRELEEYAKVRSPFSFEQPLANRKVPTYLKEVVRDKRADTAREAEEHILSEGIEAILTNDLPPDELQLLQLRYGRELSQTQTGDQLGLTKSRVYKTQAKILTKLRPQISALL